MYAPETVLQGKVQRNRQRGSPEMISRHLTAARRNWLWGYAVKQGISVAVALDLGQPQSGVLSAQPEPRKADPGPFATWKAIDPRPCRFTVHSTLLASGSPSPTQPLRWSLVPLTWQSPWGEVLLQCDSNWGCAESSTRTEFWFTDGMSLQRRLGGGGCNAWGTRCFSSQAFNYDVLLFSIQVSF